MTPEYIAAVRAASDEPLRRGPPVRARHRRRPRLRRHARGQCAQSSPERSRAAARSGQGQAEHAVNFCGGLHHAMPASASGFCVYNDVAVGIQWLLDHGAEKVAYVDVDVHHGDGVETDLLERPPGAHDLGARDGPGPVPRHRVAHRHRRGGRRGHRDQRVVASWPVGCRLAARDPRHRSTPRASLRARRAGLAARLRHPRRRPPGALRHERRRPTVGRRRACTGWPTR